MLKHKRYGVAFAMVFALSVSAHAAALTPWTQGARQYYPCEVSFEMQPDEMASRQAAMSDDLLHIEFRSPGHATYSDAAFLDRWTNAQDSLYPNRSGSVDLQDHQDQ